MSKTKEKPLYAVIPYTGKGYTITFEKRDNYTGISQTGYGELPEEYNSIPIIDFTDNDKVFDYLRLNLYPHEVFGSFTNCSIKEYFTAIQNLGITIKNLA